MKNITSKTVIFVTGNFVSNSGWDPWKAHFESKGYKTLAPAWLFKDAPAATLRARHPDAGIASNRLTKVVDHFANIIKALPEKPIIIGHSMGGLITQLLIQRGLGAAGIAIHSVPPLGVFATKFSFYKATWGPLGFFTSAKKTFMMSFEKWQYAFTNGMSLEDQKKSYEENTIPESKLMSRDALTPAAKINFSQPHAPLLFMAGTEDHIMPASVNYSNYKKYKNRNNNSITDFIEFKGRNHYVLGQPTWKENADYILNWINK